MSAPFDASAIAFARDPALNARYLVLAERPDGAGRRLEIQRALHADEQDRALGQDTYCLVAEDQVTHYGGVLSWRIDGSTLELALDEDASRTLGAAQIRIALPASERAVVEGALRALLS